MRIEQKAEINGFKAIKVRDTLKYFRQWTCFNVVHFHRRFNTGYFHHSSHEEKQKELSELLLSLLKLKYLRVVPDDQERGFDPDLPLYRLTELGLRFCAAPATKPISRKKADLLVAEFLQRCRYLMRQTTEYIYVPDRVILFGSYVGESPTLGDIDIAIEYRNRHQDPARQNALAEELLKDAPRYLDYLTEGTWLAQRPELFLKGGSHSFSLQSIDRGILSRKPHLPQREIFNYAQGGDLTFAVPKRLKGLAESAYRIGYGDRLDGIEPAHTEPGKTETPFFRAYWEGYKACVPPATKKARVKTKPTPVRMLVSFAHERESAHLNQLGTLVKQLRFGTGWLGLVDAALTCSVSQVGPLYESQGYQLLTIETRTAEESRYAVHFGPSEYSRRWRRTLKTPPCFSLFSEAAREFLPCPESDETDWLEVLPFYTKNGAIKCVQGLCREWKRIGAIREKETDESWTSRGVSTEDFGHDAVMAEAWFHRGHCSWSDGFVEEANLPKVDFTIVAIDQAALSSLPPEANPAIPRQTLQKTEGTKS